MEGVIKNPLPFLGLLLWALQNHKDPKEQPLKSKVNPSVSLDETLLEILARPGEEHVVPVL